MLMMSGSSVGLFSKGTIAIHLLSLLHMRYLTDFLNVCRPYLHIYLNQSDSEQQGIINLSQVKIDYKKDLENMLEVSNK